MSDKTALYIQDFDGYVPPPEDGKGIKYSGGSFVWEEPVNLPTVSEDGYIPIVSGGNLIYAETIEHTKLLQVGGEDKELHEPHGFPTRDKSTIAWDAGTRTFTLGQAGADPVVVWTSGTRHELSGMPKTVVWDDVEGNHFIYLDLNSNLVSTTDSSILTDLILGYNGTFVATLYWDATNNVIVTRGDERHGLMDGITHLDQHFGIGTKWYSGGLLQNFTINSGNANSHAQFSVENVQYADEDIIFNALDGSPQDLSPILNAPVLYLLGPSANPTWRVKPADAYPLIQSGAAGYTGVNGLIAYNQLTGGNYQLTQVPTGQFVNVTIYAINDPITPIISILGQQVHTSLTNARAAIITELSRIANISRAFGQEGVPLGSVIYQTATTYTNAVRARTQGYATGVNYFDWRRLRLGAGTTSSSTADRLLTITSADTTPGNLNTKLLVENGLTKTIGSPAADETLTIGLPNGYDGYVLTWNSGTWGPEQSSSSVNLPTLSEDGYIAYGNSGNLSYLGGTASQDGYFLAWDNTNSQFELLQVSGASSTLAQVLINGNTTGGTDILLTTGDEIQVGNLAIREDANPFNTIFDYGANELLISYNKLQSNINTQDLTISGGYQLVLEGTSTANQGSLIIRSSANPITSGAVGDVQISAADADQTGSTGGKIFLLAGDGITNSSGGGIDIIAGNGATVDSSPRLGGTVLVEAGNSTETLTGGGINLFAGESVDGYSGNVTLKSPQTNASNAFAGDIDLIIGNETVVTVGNVSKGFIPSPFTVYKDGYFYEDLEAFGIITTKNKIVDYGNIEFIGDGASKFINFPNNATTAGGNLTVSSQATAAFDESSIKLSGGNSDNGMVEILSGTGDGYGGNINVTAANGDYGGVITLQAGEGIEIGGDVLIFAGNGDSEGPGAAIGGNVKLIAATGDSSGAIEIYYSDTTSGNLIARFNNQTLNSKADGYVLAWNNIGYLEYLDPASFGGGGSVVKVSADDTTAGYLEDKLSVYGYSGLELTTANPAGNENRYIRRTSYLFEYDIASATENNLFSTGPVNDWSGCDILLLAGGSIGGAATITGFSSDVKVLTKTIFNRNGFDVTLSNNDVGSSSSNRILCPPGFVLADGESANITWVAGPDAWIVH